MSSSYVVSNNGISTLAAAITLSSQTSITVAAGHGVRFPSPINGDYALVTLENAAGVIEIVSIVGRLTDTLTVGIAGSAVANAAGRGMEGTTATTWIIGDIIEGRATAAIMQRGGNAKTTLELIAAGGAALIGNTPAGLIAATTVQAAINELDTEKAALAGSATQVFSVAAATANDHAVSLIFGDGRYAFPAGTRLAFNQTAAPTGWTKDTTAALNDTAMRIVTGAVGSGGSVALSTATYTPTITTAVGTLAAASHALTIAEMPSHTSVPSNTLTGGILYTAFGGSTLLPNAATSQGGGGGHTHTISGAPTATSSAITLALKYNDFIIAVKV